MKTSKLIASSVLLALCWAMPATAKDSGWYIGGSIGSATLEVDSVDFDENDFAWKAFGGYQFGSLLAIEGGYVDFGTPSDGPLKIDPYGLDAFAVLGLPLGPVRVFGKLGGVYWDVDTSNGGSDDSTDLAAGVGLEIELASFGVRGEVEYFDALDGIYMVSIGATYTF